MVEESAVVKTRNLLSRGRFNIKTLAQALLKANGAADPLTLFYTHILQLQNAATQCEFIEVMKPNLTKLIALCKNESYRNSDRCFRLFLLVTKCLNDANALKMFNAFYGNQIFTQLSDFYISWARRCEANHGSVRSILIKAERMDAKPKSVLESRKRQFAEKEQRLILGDTECISDNGESEERAVYPWDTAQQANVMASMEQPNFIKFYNNNMPPFNFIFKKLSLPKQSIKNCYSYVCMIYGIPNRYFALKVSPRNLSHWDVYIHEYVKEELGRISGIVQIYNCITFVDRCLTVQAFLPGTLKDLMELQGLWDIKLSEFIIAIITLDLMKLLQCIHRMNVIHGCFRSDMVYVANRITSRPQLDRLRAGAVSLVKLSNWEFAIRNVGDAKYSAEYINENKIVTDGDYKCKPWNYEIDRLGLLNIVNELFCSKKLRYLKCRSGRFIPSLNLKRNLMMHKLWYQLFYKCLDLETNSWSKLIDELAQATDDAMRAYEDLWITAGAQYNILFMELYKKNTKFYP